MGRIQLRHPDGKKAPTMEFRKYCLLKEALTCCLAEGRSAIFADLADDVSHYLARQKKTPEGRLEWSLFWVTLNMESTGELLKDRTRSPLRYTLP